MIPKIRSLFENHHRLFIVLVIFVVGILGTWVPRIGIPYLHDDTLAIVWTANNSINGEDPSLLTEIPDRLELIGDRLYHSLPDPGTVASHYRPLDDALSQFIITFWPDSPVIPTLIHSLVLCLTACFISLIVISYFGNKFVAIGSAILYLFAIPTLVGSWLTIHPQPYINLFITCGLYIYICYSKTHKPVFLILLWLVAIIAPYFRELAFILPFTILGTIILERKKDPFLWISIVLLCFHASFPSFLPTLLIKGEVILQSQYRGGFAQLVTLTDNMGIFNNIYSQYRTIAYTMPYQLSMFFPPILTATCFIGIGYYCYQQKVLVVKLLIYFVTPLFAIIFSILSVAYSIKDALWCLQFGFIPLLLFIVVTISSIRYGKILFPWFIVSGLPFIFIFNGFDLHIWAVSIPWVILLLLWSEYLYKWLKQRTSHIKPLKSIFYVAFILVSLIIMGDHIMGVISVRQVWGDIASGIEKMAKYFETIPKNSMVICNFNHAVDVEYFSHSTVKHYITMNWYGYIKDREIHTIDEIIDIYDKYQGNINVYLLAEDWNGNNAAHPILVNYINDTILEEKFDINSSYCYIDPLRTIIPVKYFKRTAPPDLLYSFKLEKAFFRLEYNQSYSLYRLNIDEMFE